MVLEGRFGGRRSAARSSSMKGERWPRLRHPLVVVLVQSVIGLRRRARARHDPGRSARSAGGIVASLAGAYTAAVSVVLYFDIRCRKEAFEVEQLARIVEAGTGGRGGVTAEALATRHPRARAPTCSRAASTRASASSSPNGCAGSWTGCREAPRADRRAWSTSPAVLYVAAPRRAPRARSRRCSRTSSGRSAWRSRRPRRSRAAARERGAGPRRRGRRRSPRRAVPRGRAHAAARVPRRDALAAAPSSSSGTSPTGRSASGSLERASRRRSGATSSRSSAARGALVPRPEPAPTATASSSRRGAISIGASATPRSRA